MHSTQHIGHDDKHYLQHTPDCFYGLSELDDISHESIVTFYVLLINFHYSLCRKVVYLSEI